MSPRRMSIIALVAIIPIWIYALGIAGGVIVGLSSTICVLLVAGGLYLMFGPHEEEHTDGIDADSV